MSTKNLLIAVALVSLRLVSSFKYGHPTFFLALCSWLRSFIAAPLRHLEIAVHAASNTLKIDGEINVPRRSTPGRKWG